MTTTLPPLPTTALPAWWPLAATGVHLDVLDRGRCLQHLDEAQTGWLSYLQPAQSVEVAVPYRVSGTAVVLSPTAASAQLLQGPSQLVLFRVDHIDPDLHTGWTVVTVGRLTLQPQRSGTSAQRTAYNDLVLDLLSLTGRSISTTPAFFPTPH